MFIILVRSHNRLSSRKREGGNGGETTVDKKNHEASHGCQGRGSGWLTANRVTQRKGPRADSNDTIMARETMSH